MIARRCAAADEGTALIFNCQMGRGRTTTAMIIAALVRCRLHAAPQQHSAPSTAAASGSEDDKLMLEGDYAVVRSLVRVVEGGKEAKAAADKARARGPGGVCVAAEASLVVPRADHRQLRTYAEPPRGHPQLPTRTGARGI